MTRLGFISLFIAPALAIFGLQFTCVARIREIAPANGWRRFKCVGIEWTLERNLG